ncbi:MAG: PilZ domain-containing protein [Pseudomonadota bacterium]|nr:PilZ domain-containing protein [Pseudomonadota bacterium]
MTNPDVKRLPRRLYQRPVGILSESGYCVNDIVEISEGGIMARSSAQQYPVDSSVLLNFYLPEGGMIIIRAEARWTKNVFDLPGTFIGFQFNKVTFQHRRLIRAYVAEKRPDELDFEKYKMSAPDQPILETKLDSRATRREAVRK